MGKKSNLKKQRRSQPIQVGTSKPSTMDPVLIEAYVKGRTVGIKQGKVDGIAEIMTMFDQWIDEMDKRVKGIGPKTKMDIQMYFADRIKESIEKNKLTSMK
jgi:hypothetical protein